MGKKNIWIVNYYTTPPEYIFHPRHLKFAAWLMEDGYDVTIISSSYLHHKNINLITTSERLLNISYNNLKFVHIKSISYTGNGIRRMFSIIQFALTLYLYRRKIEKPEIILHNIHAPFDIPVYWCAKWFKAKYIAEAWDLWPESFIWAGLASKNNPLIRFSYKMEKTLYENADRIIFSMEGGKDYLSDKNWDLPRGGRIDPGKVHYINNGVDLEEFDSNIKEYRIDDNDLSDKHSFKVIYLGSIRLVNNLKQLIDAALILKGHTKIKLLIYGDGPERGFLEDYCLENNISNVLFKDKWIDLKYVPYVVSCSSVNILNYQKGFGSYGTSSGKLFQYLASGKPIISNTRMKYCLINRHNLGVSKDIESPEDYADAIVSIKDLARENYDSMCARARSTAEQFEYKKLYYEFSKIIKGLGSSKII
jgi:glycosyltransferase involved in cell wall biosynthesis